MEERQVVDALIEMLVKHVDTINRLTAVIASMTMPPEQEEFQGTQFLDGSIG